MSVLPCVLCTGLILETLSKYTVCIVYGIDCRNPPKYRVYEVYEVYELYTPQTTQQCTWHVRLFGYSIGG